MIHYVVPAARDNGIRVYLGNWGLPLAERMRILHYEDLLGRTRLEPGTYILSALGQLGPGIVRYLTELVDQVDGTPRFRFVNHPVTTLPRFELLSELHRRGRNAFRVVRANGDLSGLRYPVFLRTERTHEGAASPLLRSAGQIEGAIGRAIVQGRRLRDLLVVEFCPTADEDGWYRKYAALVVGDRILPRHLAVGKDWMLKYDSPPAIAAEELEYVESNPHRDQLAEIFQIAGAEYGRIDYSLSGGRVQTWEINLNPFVGYAKVPPHRRLKNERFYPRFQAALEALDIQPATEAPERETVPLTFAAGTVRAARAERVRPSRQWRGRGKLFRAARPFLEPLAGPIFPPIGRLARRRDGHDRALSAP